VFFFVKKVENVIMVKTITPLVKRIDSVLESQQKGRKELMEAIGVSHNAISSWNTRETIPAADIALRIADYLGVSVRWLVTGEDEDGYTLDERNLVIKYRCLPQQGQFEIKALLDAKLTVQKEKDVEDTAVYQSDLAVIESKDLYLVAVDKGNDGLVSEPVPAYGERIVNISRFTHAPSKDGVKFTGWEMTILPHYGRVAAGFPIEMNLETGWGVPYPKPKLKGKEEDYFTVEASGTSMTEAGIQDGDIVVIRRTATPKQGKIMLVRHGDESTLKKIKIKEKNGQKEYYLQWQDGSDRSQLIDDPDWEVQGEYHGLMRE